MNSGFSDEDWLNKLERKSNSSRTRTVAKASQKHGTEYANALDGHSGYLEQYYRITLNRRGEMYQELEQDLLIESVPVE